MLDQHTYEAVFCMIFTDRVVTSFFVRQWHDGAAPLHLSVDTSDSAGDAAAFALASPAHTSVPMHASNAHPQQRHYANSHSSGSGLANPYSDDDAEVDSLSTLAAAQARSASGLLVAAPLYSQTRVARVEMHADDVLPETTPGNKVCDVSVSLWFQWDPSNVPCCMRF